MTDIRDEWNTTRLILEAHQHAGNQISGGCGCGFAGERVGDYLDHLTDELCGIEAAEEQAAEEMP